MLYVYYNVNSSEKYWILLGLWKRELHTWVTYLNQQVKVQLNILKQVINHKVKISTQKVQKNTFKQTGIDSWPVQIQFIMGHNKE